VARRREKRGFGSIRRLSSGNYQARYLAQSGDRVTAPTTFLSRMDAEAWLLAERRIVQDVGSWHSPKERLAEERLQEELNTLPTFETYAERWIETRRSSRGEPLRPTTKDKYRSTLRTHVYPTFGTTPLDKITRAAVRRWHDELDAGPAAKSDAYSTIRTILNTAVDDELIDKNPAQIRGAAGQARRKRLRPASATELAIMVDAMPEQLRLLILLATWCALRSGELRELRRSDVVITRDESGAEMAWVEVSRGVVHVRTTRADGTRTTEALVGPPKTEAGIRSVSIPEFLIPTVRQHLEEHAAPGPVGLLFHSVRDDTLHLSQAAMNGRPAVLHTDGSVRKAGFGWREARRLAGREDLDLHDLRHTGATWAAEEGASIAELMYRLGHSTPSMAIHYQHSRQERDREISRRLSRRNGLRAV
jgi:integrase